VVLPAQISGRRNSDGGNNSVLSMTIDNKIPHVIDKEPNLSELDRAKKDMTNTNKALKESIVEANETVV